MKRKKTRLRVWSYFEPGERVLLRTPTRPVTAEELATDDVQTLIDDMLVTMKQADGIGLAAPQVGRPFRLAVVAADADQALLNPLVLVNPTITFTSTEQLDGEEGCLSIVGVFGLVKRAQHIRLNALDRQGHLQSYHVRDVLARVIQHEIDHLNGVLFIDKATSYSQGGELVP